MTPEIQALDAEREALFARQRELREQAEALRERRDAAVQAHLDSLSDEQILGDETAKRWLLKESYAHSGAHQRKEQVAAIHAEGAKAEGYDLRPEYEASILPGIELALEHHQPVEELADAIRSWAAEWGLGRPDIPVSILEATCAAYGGRYDVASDTLRIDVQRYGRVESVANLPLADSLKYVADNLPVSGNEDADEYED